MGWVVIPGRDQSTNAGHHASVNFTKERDSWRKDEAGSSFCTTFEAYVLTTYLAFDIPRYQFFPARPS